MGLLDFVLLGRKFLHSSSVTHQKSGAPTFFGFVLSCPKADDPCVYTVHVYIREDLIRQSTFSFGHCPN